MTAPLENRAAGHRSQPGPVSCSFAITSKDSHAKPFPPDPPGVIRVFYGMLCCVLFALAGGAALSVLAMFTQPLGRMAGLPEVITAHPVAWLALPAGWLLGTGLRHWVQLGAVSRAVLGAAALAIAAGYANCLLTWGRIASAFGIGFVQAMRDAGFANTLALARLGLSPTDGVLYVLALALAAWGAGRARRAVVSRPGP
jgi:hypothetical protein